MPSRTFGAKKKVPNPAPRSSRRGEPPTKLKGTKDIIPEEWRYWRLVADKALQLAKIYDFDRLETPLLEPLMLFERAFGKQSDMVTKNLYSFLDHDNDKVALRPQLRPSLVRAAMEHALIDETKFAKLCMLGPVFRYDRIQSGLLRQHTQWSLDVINNLSPIADALVIMIGYNFFKELQLEVRVDINSLGDAECRAAYSAKLAEFYKEQTKKIKLPLELKKQLAKHPIEGLSSTDEKLQEINQDAPAIVDFLSEEAKNHFFAIIEHLDAFGVPYNLNSKLFGGTTDYYNRTVFEFISPEEEGRKETVLGSGGRYDNLFDRLFGKPISAVGLAIGLERTVSRIRNLNLPVEDPASDIYLAQLGDQPRQKALAMFEELRKAGFKVSQGFLHSALKHQLEEAQRMNVRYTLILGQKELMDGTIIIRDMESGAQEVVDAKKIIHEIEKRLGSK
ncbi:MAG: histidine--tRNA ligase [Candidatus Falkowbacteria bacterium]|nr:histidine--tRNA ligase [Candidatus Falkowbacteria bacterium]